MATDMITVKGLDEVIKKISETEISDELEKKLLKIGGEIFFKAIKQGTPYLTGDMRKSWISKIKTVDGVRSYRIWSDQREAYIVNHGSSHGKQHVGYFDKAVDLITDDAIKSVEREFLDTVGWD